MELFTLWTGPPESGGLGQRAADFGDATPGQVRALALGMRSRSARRGKRAGSISELKAMAGARRRKEPGEIVLTDGWDGRRGQ